MIVEIPAEMFNPKTLDDNSKSGEQPELVTVFVTDDSIPNKDTVTVIQKQETEESTWLNDTETVTVDQHPPAIDESARMRVRKLPNGRQEEVFECEYCKKVFITPPQLTGLKPNLGEANEMLKKYFFPAHRWSHTKPFQCETCLARFPAKGNLVSK